MQVHLARGLVSTDLNQWDLNAILQVVSGSAICGLQAYIEALVGRKTIGNASVVILGLRNDGELAQALLVGRRIKQLTPKAIVILDASGANEQFSFASWVGLLSSQKEKIAECLDYFLPQEDYKATLRQVLDSVIDGKKELNLSNAVQFGPALAESSHTDSCSVAPAIEEAFCRYAEHQEPFLVGGDRAFLTRLSPGKCHWSACAFCTINSQHLLPRASASVDSKTKGLIDRLIANVIAKQIRHLILMDEALPPSVLFSLAEAIQHAGLSILYRARCRFSDDFTEERCKLLFDSGCRFLGLGLESASARINQMVNKHLGPAPDYMRVITDLSNAGVRPHIYSIMGFPTETPEETKQTRDFLLQAVRQHPYVTVSANTFHLMRGSNIFAEPNRYGITEVYAEGDIALVLQFREPVRDAHCSGPHEAAREVFRAQYLPDVDDAESAQAFWHFVDQTGIFYLQKVLLARNPYHDLATSRIVPPDYLERYYTFDNLAVMSSGRQNGSVVVFSWITNNYVRIPDAIIPFVVHSHESRTIQENLSEFVPTTLFSMGKKVVRSLIAAGGLSPASGKTPMDDREEAIVDGGVQDIVVAMEG